jgi:hypothetical protein
LVVAAGHGAAVEEELGAVVEGVLDGIVVKILIDVFAFVLRRHVIAEMAAAAGLSRDGPGVFHPATFVDVVNVEIAVETAAGPEEAVEAANLKLQLADLVVCRGAVFPARGSAGDHLLPEVFGR